MSHGFFSHNFPYTEYNGVHQHYSWREIQIIRLFGTKEAKKISLQKQVNNLALNQLSGWVRELVHHTPHNEHTFLLCEMLCNEYAKEFKEFLKEGNIGFVFIHGDTTFIAPPISTTLDFTLLKKTSEWQHGDHDDLCMHLDSGVLTLHQHLDITKLQNLKEVKPAISLFKTAETHNSIKLTNDTDHYKLLGGVAAIIGIPTAALLTSQNDNEDKPKKTSAKYNTSKKRLSHANETKYNNDIPFL